jgi:hypothetical protein
VVIIPFPDLPNFTQDVALDGTVYRLRVLWNERAGSWSLSFLTPGDAPILEGMKLVLDTELLARFPGLPLPPGELWVLDPAGNLQELGRRELPEGRALLVYFDEAEA